MNSAIKRLCILFLTVLNSGCTFFPQKSDFVDCNLNAFPISSELKSNKPNLITGEICISEDFTLRKYSDVLVISGGASDGAFGAGYISNLVDTKQMAVFGDNDHPRPCIITGVSTGAMMSPFVYLATSSDSDISSKYSDLLKELYLSLDDNQLLEPKFNISTIVRLRFKKSLYSPATIKNELDKQINHDLINDLVKEYRETKRKIYIGVVNVSTGNYEIIDLTRLFENIVESGHKQNQKLCMTEAIRASISIPMVFEPVPILDNQVHKLYVDGGLRYPLFLHKQMIEALKEVGMKEGKPTKSVRAYVVINHFGLTEQFLKDDDEFKSLTLKKYIFNNTEIARNQLYLDASSTLYQVTKNENILSYWVDAQSDKKCKKPEDKYFHTEYQKCLRDLGIKKSNEDIPWSLEPNLKPLLLD